MCFVWKHKTVYELRISDWRSDVCSSDLALASLDVPFRVTTELAPAPWNGKRQLLMIGIKGYDVPNATLPPANLVLLLDTSGSMNSPDKLPLLRQSMKQ